MQAMRVGLCGLGTVGSSLLQLLSRQPPSLSRGGGASLQITRVGARRVPAHCNLEGIAHSTKVLELAQADDVDVLVELIGGTDTALDLVRRALEQGKHVVTANKALLAEHGDELFLLARRQGLRIGFEASVAGGIPVIRALREGLVASTVTSMIGIINGTCNFILTEMQASGCDFSQALRLAGERGYAEADPTLDVDGTDARHKLGILASLAYDMPLRLCREVHQEGITKVDVRDLDYARELGYVIRHLSVASRQPQGLELRVHPALVPRDSLLAHVEGVMNALWVNGRETGPTLYYGAGAGGMATASAVMADLVSLARGALPECPSPVTELPLLSQAQFRCAYYLRMEAEDVPGVLSAITRLLGDAGISVEALVQREPASGMDRVPLALITNEVLEQQMLAVLAELDQLPLVDALTWIRVVRGLA